MILLSVRCSVSCLFIIALTGLLQIIHAESFRPIFNPNVALKPTAKKITAISTTTTTTTTVRPLTTISATLKSRVSLTKQQQAPSSPQHGSRAPVKPLSAPSQAPLRPANDNVQSDTKDAPVAEALRGDWRRWRRPYYPPYPSNNYLPASSRYRRRPSINPKPYFAPPTYNGYNFPYEDYRFETDFLDPAAYVPKSKPKLPAADTGKDYGIVDTDIGAFYDSQSATYNVPPLKNYDTQSNYYATGTSGVGSVKGGSSIGSGAGAGYSDYADTDEYKYSTSKPKTNYKALQTRAPIKHSKNRNKFASYDEDYRYSSDMSHDSDDMTTEHNSAAKFNNIYLPHQTIYQTAPKKPKPRPIKTTTTTTYTPPIKISDTSIDVLTKPLGSATFNLNLSPGTVYSPPLNYNPPANNYNPTSSNNYKPIPLQPPATSYGVPIAPPLNSFTYQNSYQNQYGGYPPSIAQNSGSYVNPASISITNSLAPRSPGLFAEPPPLNQQTLSNIDVSYNNVQSSYDATPKQSRPTKRKPTKVNSKRVPTKRPALNTDEELADDEQSNEQQRDIHGESYSFYKTMPQPSLPNTYDQEEFHTVKNKRKQTKHNLNYYERDEKIRTTKKPKQPIEVTLRIPDEDYLDDLVKVVQTTKRPKKKAKQSSTHNLDTEDLRDAYENNSAYVPKKKTKTNTRYLPSGDYEQYDEESSEEDDYENDRLSSVNSKEETKSSTDTDANGEASQDSPYWDKDSSIYKQYGIRARNDNFPVSGSYEVRGYNNGFRPIRQEQPNIYFTNPFDVRATRVRDIGTSIDNSQANGNRISSTLRSVTTTVKPSSLYVWDGGELPKNHKLV